MGNVKCHANAKGNGREKIIPDSPIKEPRETTLEEGFKSTGPKPCRSRGTFEPKKKGKGEKIKGAPIAWRLWNFKGSKTEEWGKKESQRGRHRGGRKMGGKEQVAEKRGTGKKGELTFQKSRSRKQIKTTEGGGRKKNYLGKRQAERG